jgi:hypothetical protein
VSDAAAAATPPEATTIQPASAPAPETTSPSGNEPAAETSLLSEAKEPAEGEKAKEAPAPEPFDPEKVTFPDGMQKDDALFTEFTNIAKEHKLSAPVAQGLIDLYAKQLQASAQKQQAEWAETQADWQAQVKADPDIGGDKLEPALREVSKFFDNPICDPGTRAALAITGAGNHKAIVKTFVNIAKVFNEGGAIRGNPASGNRPPETLGQAIYGQNGPHVGGPKFS